MLEKNTRTQNQHCGKYKLTDFDIKCRDELHQIQLEIEKAKLEAEKKSKKSRSGV